MEKFCSKTFSLLRRKCVFFLLILFSLQGAAQNFAGRSFAYNTLLGGFSGGIGAIINKTKNQKWYKAFAKGFITGTAGGALMFGGKKINYYIAKKQSLAYGWASRAVFSAGNSIVENAAANRPFWSVWHYDLSFVRVEFNAQAKTVLPRVMPSMLASTVFLACNGRLNLETSLRSGTATFYTDSIHYAPKLAASTLSNGFLFRNDLLTGQGFYNVYAHEMIHTFQFQETSGINYFAKPLTDKWERKSNRFRKLHKWIYGDLNYELMAINYFLINRGFWNRDYCHNFLENEAESLSTNRSACPRKH